MGEIRNYHVIIMQVIRTDGEQFLGYLVNREKELFTSDLTVAQLFASENCVNKEIDELANQLESAAKVLSYYITSMEVDTVELKLIYNANI